jgi:hypothetical protein
VTRVDRTALDAALCRLYGQASAPGRLMDRLAGADEIEGVFDPVLDELPLLHERAGAALWAGTGLESSIGRSLARMGAAPPAPAPEAPVVARPEGRVSRNAPVAPAGRARVAAMLDEAATGERAPASTGADTTAREQATSGRREARTGHAARRPGGAPAGDGTQAPGEQPARSPRARRAWTSSRPDREATSSVAGGPAAAPVPEQGRASGPAPGPLPGASARVPAPHDHEPAAQRARRVIGLSSDSSRARTAQLAPGHVSTGAARARWQRAAERAGATSALTRPVTAGVHAGAPGLAEHTSRTLQAIARDTADIDALAGSPAVSTERAAVGAVPSPDTAGAEPGAPAAGAPVATARRLASALSRLSQARRGSPRAVAASPAAPTSLAGPAAPAGPASLAAPAAWPASAPASSVAGPAPFGGPEPFAVSSALREPPALEGLSGLRRMAALAGVDPALGASPGSDAAPAWSPTSSFPSQPGARPPLPALAPPVAQPGGRDDRALADRIAEILRREAARHGIDVERDEP